MSPRSYAIVGVGAVGGYYGARLAAAGHPVTWVARSDADHLRTRGLEVRSPRGDLHLTDLDVVAPGESVAPTDVVVLATKALDNPAMAPVVAPLVGPDTVVLVLQNGLDVERPLAEALPGTPVLGAMSFICSTKVGPGVVEHADYEAVNVGAFSLDDRAVGVTAAVEAVVGDLAGAGVPTEALPDLLVGRWKKLVWNVPFNGLSVVLGAGTDELMADPSALVLVRSLMEEVVGAAAAHGHPVPEGSIDTMLERTAKMTPYAPSMQVDLRAGRPLELGPIYGAPLSAAAAAGYAMPRTGALHRQLAFLDARNRR